MQKRFKPSVCTGTLLLRRGTTCEQDKAPKSCLNATAIWQLGRLAEALTATCASDQNF